MFRKIIEWWIDRRTSIARLIRERDEARTLAGKLQEDIDTMYDPAIEHLTRERDEARKAAGEYQEKLLHLG